MIPIDFESKEKNKIISYKLTLEIKLDRIVADNKSDIKISDTTLEHNDGIIVRNNHDRYNFESQVIKPSSKKKKLISKLGFVPVYDKLNGYYVNPFNGHRLKFHAIKNKAKLRNNTT
jgi:hypothetical protein